MEENNKHIKNIFVANRDKFSYHHHFKEKYNSYTIIAFLICIYLYLFCLQ